LEHKREEQVLRQRGGDAVSSGRGKEVGKVYGRVNIVQVLCTYVCNGKMIPIETIQEWGEGEIKEYNGVCKFKYDIFDILLEHL
jgi:hypothetical protein